jgi:N-acetylgalactosamine-N,N'-diacetylbacillosaminyl-diphospho-undecaprenol 4-alpha-N-acetylgalactosaminyltransferase
VSPERAHILFVIVGISAGTGTFCKTLGAGLRKQFPDQFRVSLLTFRQDALAPENAQHFDETFTLASSVRDDWRRAIDLPKSFFKLRSTVKRTNPDLIFCIGTFSNVATSLAIADRPVVMSDHLNMTLRLRDARLGSVIGFMMRRAYPNRLMVVASQELADDLKANFGVTRSAVIANGIDGDAIRKRAAEAPSVALPERFFIFVGRLTAQKDVGTAIRAYAHAAKQGVKEDFVIAGDGEQRPMLESLARELGVDARVRFLGHCPNPYPLIQRARALILPSIWEGFAYVPIESMALGVPVIATACPSGPREILGDGQFGLLVPPSDPPAMADAMLRLSAEDALHARLIAQSHLRAAELSVENMCRAYREVFMNELQSWRQTR